MDRLVHDMREPLRAINVFAEILEESPNTTIGSEDRQYLAEIRGGASRMQSLLEGLAAYAMSLHEAAAPAASASLQSALKIVLANMGDAKVTSGELPRVCLSLERAMQLFEHLISNSLKFGATEIDISATEEDGGMCAVSVRDNGMGIPEEHREDVFRPFMRVAGKKYPGAGMGLAICQRIVEAHGGEIHMHSAPERGVICTFTLPLA